MSYPHPPGTNPSSLPPRPPPSKVSGGFKPAFSSAAASPAHTPSPVTGASPYQAPPSYIGPQAPSAPTQQHYGAPPTTYQSGPRMNQGRFQQQQRYQQYPQQQQNYSQSSYYGAPQSSTPGAGSTAPYGAPPQMRNNNHYNNSGSTHNSHNSHNSGSNSYGDDPEMAAQIAQWQSAYSKEPIDSAATAGAPAAYSAADAAKIAEANSLTAQANAEDKKKTVVRAGGGQKWTDDSLLEWDPAHLRLFVGNLAGETTDESLYKAFAGWKSLSKARVVRDKVTSKSRGYGFVSFAEADDFFQAAKEMNGKYIQSHPVVVRKSTTEIKPHTVKDKRHGGKWNNKNKNRGGGGGGGGRGGSGAGRGGHEAAGTSNGYEPNLGPRSNAGVTKPGQKTKGGLKLLG